MKVGSGDSVVDIAFDLNWRGRKKRGDRDGDRERDTERYRD